RLCDGAVCPRLGLPVRGPNRRKSRRSGPRSRRGATSRACPAQDQARRAMTRTIRVHIGETPRLVGAIRYNKEGARESAVFEYDPAWLGARDGFAIDPALPLQPGPQFHKKTRDGSVFHSAIADTGPD